MQSNPLLEPEDYMKQYRDNVNDLKNDPNVIEFDKLIYELFEMNPQGKRFLELFTERYLIPGVAHPDSPTFQIKVIWGEGMKEFGRIIISSIRSHQQKTNAEMNK